MASNKAVMNISPMQLTVAPNGRQQSPTRAELELQVAHFQQAAAQAQQETAQAQEATAQAQQELADSRKRDYSNMAGQQSDDDSDEEDTSATTWPRQMNIGTFVPILVGKFEELEWTSERPIRNPSAKPVWKYHQQMNIVVNGGSLFAVKWDETRGSLTQIGATNIITSTCITLAAFTACRVMLISTTNNELASETVEKLKDTVARLGPEYAAIVDICHGKDITDRSLCHAKLIQFQNRMLVVVDSSDVNGFKRHANIVTHVEKFLPGSVHFFIDEIDDTIRTMPGEGTTAMMSKQCEEERNKICSRVTKVHGCTATPEAVFDYFKTQRITAPALGFSDEWVDGTIRAEPDETKYVGLGDIRPIPDVGHLPPLAALPREFQNARVGDYILGLTKDMGTNKESAMYKFVDKFLEDERGQATMLVSLTAMVNSPTQPYDTIQQIIAEIASRRAKQPTMKEVAYILHHRAREAGKNIAILTVNGENKDSKFYLSHTSGSTQAIYAGSAYGALSKCPPGKLVVVLGPSAARGRSFVTETRVPTHMIMMNGRRSAENGVDQPAGRVTGCHKDKLGGQSPYILCTKDDFDRLGNSDEHGLRRQYRAQTGNALALDLRNSLGLNKADAPAMYPSIASDDSILQATHDCNSGKYLQQAGSVCRMAMIVTSVRNGHEPSMLNDKMKEIVHAKGITGHEKPITLDLLTKLATEIHNAWGLSRNRGRNTKNFALYAFRPVKTRRQATLKNLTITSDAHNVIANIMRAKDAPISPAVPSGSNGSPHTALPWSESMVELQQRLGTHWPCLCNKVADRFLEPDSTEQQIDMGGQVSHPPKEYVVINARRSQKPVAV